MNDLSGLDEKYVTDTPAGENGYKPIRPNNPPVLSPEILPQVKTSSFEVVPVNKVLDRLCEEIDMAQEEILLQFMNVNFKTDRERRLLNALLEKKSQMPEVRVRLIFSKHSLRSADDYEAVRRLVESGVEIVYSDRSMLFSPLMGQNHRKIGCFDRKRSFIGGVNILEEVLSGLDALTFTDNEELTSILCGLLEDSFIINRPLKPPYTVHHLTSNEDPDQFLNCTRFDLIVEEGGPDRRSKVIDETVELVNSAQKSVTIVSQFLPDGRLLQALIRAVRRGVKVQVVTNHPSHIEGLHYSSGARVNKFRIESQIKLEQFYNLLRRNGNGASQSFNIVTLDERVHMKAVLVDGKEVIYGSDNLIRPGELFETAEVAIRTNNEDVVAGYEELIDRALYRNPNRR